MGDLVSKGVVRKRVCIDDTMLCRSMILRRWSERPVWFKQPYEFTEDETFRTSGRPLYGERNNAVALVIIV